jgi:NADH:ubiquinone oxidoreductase subunit C
MDAQGVRDLLAGCLGPEAARSAAAEGHRLSMEVTAERLPDAAAALLQAERARFVTLVAVDTGLEVELLYTFAAGGVLAVLRTRVPKEAASIATLTDRVPAAEMVEQEVSELFGVEFTGHPRGTNLLLPEGHAARPLREPLVGPVLREARLSLEHLLRGGASMRLTPASTTRRRAAGLPPQPPLASSDEAALEEFQELVRRTGFDRRAGYDWAKGRLRYK